MQLVSLFYLQLSKEVLDTNLFFEISYKIKKNLNITILCIRLYIMNSIEQKKYIFD
jgi:hypothetical protein